MIVDSEPVHGQSVSTFVPVSAPGATIWVISQIVLDEYNLNKWCFCSSGGLSNLLYYCALPPSHPPRHKEPSKVLLRLYGQIHGERALEGLITESVIFTLLSESQRGPRLFGVFPGGRLEEFIPARALTTDELSDPTLSCLIAEKMALVHMMDVPINKEPHWLWDTMDR
uniref:Choline kinase n=1 Tax=Timema shepardi TaxID=629360 RepID=A0A7R9AZS3_TIMSH|nr:unnamed protein product [Timema shepardi]